MNAPVHGGACLKRLLFDDVELVYEVFLAVRFIGHVTSVPARAPRSVSDMRTDLAGRPATRPPIPDSVRSRLGDDAECVWLNQAGGTTWFAGDRYVKCDPADSSESLGEEFMRMRWLDGRFPAPQPIEFAAEDDGEVLVTAALPGAGAVTDEWLRRPSDAVRAIATGLRRLHTLDAADCPFMSSAPASADDDLVVSHGDACAPNTVIAPDGSFVGIVDVARVGVADRWLDLAIASRSLGWNYGQGFEPLFFDAYGIAPDAARIRRWLDWHDSED